jgi:hypothetical protein
MITLPAKDVNKKPGILSLGRGGFELNNLAWGLENTSLSKAPGLFSNLSARCGDRLRFGSETETGHEFELLCKIPCIVDCLPVEK